MQIKKIIIDSLSQYKDINVSLNVSDLIEAFVEANKLLIAETKREFEQQIKEQNTETYPIRAEVLKILGVSTSTLWRYEKMGLLKPLDVGGKRRYRMSDVKRFMEGGKK